ncbi:hypothetical protein [Lacisediminihabitans changchengi]|uniref:Nucleotidyltransferase n=1 Tax=Lacisediminihabitans changchengi TaxID=2787634 RepID=A0A934SGY5_9MICO|nr:hypothetical protein [Lacisediminihabitans changchengi]MBK4346431.1 hypothetical protein [Lacisediminihabitans changchengi]
MISTIVDDGSIAGDRVMLVGAECRDILHASLGHEFALRRTSDIDLALAIDDWDSHEQIVRRFSRTGHTGIRYRISDISVDIMPFGSVEDPRGEVAPATRKTDPFSVFAFQEVFTGAAPLRMPSGTSIRVPTPAGYSALKLRAWHDRWTSANDDKDGPDLATVAFWYANDSDVDTTLWGTDHGRQILVASDFDYAVAAAQFMGCESMTAIGTERADELRELWRLLDLDALAKAFGDSSLPGWPMARGRRRELVDGLTTGIMTRPNTE